MGRLLGWTFGVGFALAITAAPAAAQTHVSIGVFSPGVGARVEIGRPVYEPVYPAPVYRERVVYREPVYRPVYRERVVVIERRHDNGKHKGWYKHDKHGRGGDWRDDERYERDRRW